jgi:tetratricopeptide (TPR) repeat protein
MRVVPAAWVGIAGVVLGTVTLPSAPSVLAASQAASSAPAGPPGQSGPASQAEDPAGRCLSAPEDKFKEACIEAFTWLRDTGAGAPKSHVLSARLIEGARAIGDFDGALRIARGAMEEFSERAEFPFRLGVILLDNLDGPFEAYGPLLEASRLSPKDGVIKQRLGDALLRMRRYEEALEQYRAAESLIGPNWELADGHARTLRALGRRGDALHALEAARTWECTHIFGDFTIKMRIELLRELGRHDDALREERATLARGLERNCAR